MIVPMLARIQGHILGRCATMNKLCANAPRKWAYCILDWALIQGYNFSSSTDLSQVTYMCQRGNARLSFQKRTSSESLDMRLPSGELQAFLGLRVND